MLLEIMIKKLNIIPIRKGKINIKNKLGVLSELTNLGYNIKKAHLYNESITQDYERIIKFLKEIKGENIEYIPLFHTLPQEDSKGEEYFTKKINDYINNLFILFNEEKKINNNIIIPEWLLYLSEFGENSINNLPDEDLLKINDKTAKKENNGIEWINLEFVKYEEAVEKVIQYLQDILYSEYPIKEEDKFDIEFLLNYFDSDIIEYKKVTCEENKSYLDKFYN